jgi:hypothetical protein
MADAPMSDAECIQAAYEDAMQATFKSFVSNLLSQGDNKALSEFTSGLQLVRTAKTLALGVIQNPPSGVAVPSAAAVLDKIPPKHQRKR